MNLQITPFETYGPISQTALHISDYIIICLTDEERVGYFNEKKVMTSKCMRNAILTDFPICLVAVET